VTGERSGAPSLSEPPPVERLASFPVWHVHAGTRLWRVTRAGNGPWWFSSDGSGRFDLPAPRGTCYLADDPAVALLESFGPLWPELGVSRAVVDQRRLWDVALPEQADAADATVRAARSFGVTAELGTITPYDLPHRWAAAFAAAGFDGVRARARHDPGGGRVLAWFGAAGERRGWRRGRPAAIDDTVLDQITAATRTPFATIPMAGDLDLLD
jgi:hypothetical protein